MLLSDTINENQPVQTLLALRSPDFLSSSNQLSFYAWEVINFKVTDTARENPRNRGRTSRLDAMAIL